MLGFLTPSGQPGRLCGNAVAKNGSLPFTDDCNDVVHRVSYHGPGGGTATTASPTPNAAPADAPGPKLPIAIDAREAATKGRQRVSSPDFTTGGEIPRIHSADDQNASFTVAWSAGSAGTKSDAIVMDHPDVPPPSPVNHWVTCNVPATATTLREGMERGDRPQALRGMAQGANTKTKGRVGYDGSQPPVGDPPHRYHLQFSRWIRRSNCRWRGLRGQGSQLFSKPISHPSLPFRPGRRMPLFILGRACDPRRTGSPHEFPPGKIAPRCGRLAPPLFAAPSP